MVLTVRSAEGLAARGAVGDVAAVNRFLAHLVARAFAAATVRAFAHDLLCFARFCVARGLPLGDVVAADLSGWIDWQGEGARPRVGNVVALTPHAGAAPATINRRVAAVRALFHGRLVSGSDGVRAHGLVDFRARLRDSGDPERIRRAATEVAADAGLLGRQADVGLTRHKQDS